MTKENKWLRKKGGFHGIFDIVPKVTQGLIGKEGSIEAAILLNWPLIVGDEISSKSFPIKISRSGLKNPCSGKHQDETLHLGLRNSAYALELQHLAPVIIERIAVYTGYKSVKKIKIHQDIQENIASVRYDRSKPLNNKKFNCIKADDSIKSGLENIKDENLRLALNNLIKTYN